MDRANLNAITLEKYINWFSLVFITNLKAHFNKQDLPVLPMQKPELEFGSDLSQFIETNNLLPEEIFILILAVLPHIHPSLLDDLIRQVVTDPGDFPQIGGVRGNHFRGFIPTGETALFLLAGSNLHKRVMLHRYFENDHLYAAQGILWLDEPPTGEPKFSGKIMVSAEYLELFVSGKISHPKLSMDFPAQYITTGMDWDDLVLNDTTTRQIEELEVWVNNHQVLMENWGLGRKVKPGYRVLFHGPPGTGKTLTATLLGKRTGKDVFKIDLSMVVSKFIGETEKNLSQLFNRAENKNWILFFDEADALFSKRTNIRDAHDKYANQEAAYLLQRIESFNGLVILATNFKSNIDDAFIRRFHSVIHFPAPNAQERLILWQKSFPGNVKFTSEVDLVGISKKYELTGAGIINVVQYSCLQAISQQSEYITNDLILSGIRREYLKEGKIW